MQELATRISNKKYNKSGSVFRQKTKSKLLSDDLIIDGTNLTLADYCWNCFIYIHQNPFKAKLIKRHEDWAFSSYLDFGGMRNGTICNKELASKYCSYSSETFLNDMMNDIDAGDFYFSY